MDLLKKWTDDLSLLFKFICVAGLLFFLLAYILINLSLTKEREKVLSLMENRAESLIWSLEGITRFLRRKEIHNLGGIFEETSKQPGIAWLALVNREGEILLDSNEALNNTQLYTFREMRELNASDKLQARPSPDDPQIYEFWKLFQPGRLSRHHSFANNNVIFIAMDASPYQEELKNLKIRLWFLAFSLMAAFLFLIALCFYIYHYYQSRRKLAHTEALAIQVIESYPSALIVCDNDEFLILYNQKARELFNIGQPTRPLKLADLAFYDWGHIFRLLENSATINEPDTDLHLKSGKHLILNILASRIKAPKNNDYLLVFQDFSEINLLRKKLAHSEKLSEVGKLASGLAHEIRNPLSSIKGYAHYLANRLVNDPMGQTTAQLLEEETERINNAVNELLNIIRQPKLNLRNNPLPDIIEKSCALIRPDAEARDIRIDFNQEKQSEPVNWPLTDREKLLQVFLNILLNAIQASPNGSRIQISLARKDAENGEPGWEIKFKDEGYGMTEEVRKQIFMPYFTTRANGTGLGLSISRKILETHNGSIDVASSPGHGSIFTLFLPLAK